MNELLWSAGLLAAAACVLLTRWRARRTYDTLDKMLEDAISGRFTEGTFDESRLSALETRLARYLAASEASARNLAAEKDRIKELLGDISHQTRTPLSNILLYTQLLEEQPLDEESRACVAAVGDQAEKLRFLIDALVKTSRLETGVLALRPRPADVAPLLEECAAACAPAAQAKDIALTVEPTAARARFDPKWTAEALGNLLDNAVKYTPPGGAVTLRAQPYELFTRIDVIDTGMGIPEDEQAKIFGRFYRAPAVADERGVGIGLYLARQIAAGQGGYIKVASAPGKGSTFSLFLPSEQ